MALISRPRRVLLFVENPTAYAHIIGSKALEHASTQGDLSFTVVLPPEMPLHPEDELRLKDVHVRYSDYLKEAPVDILGKSLSKPIHALSRDLLAAYNPDSTQTQDRAFVRKANNKSFESRIAYARWLKNLGLHWQHIASLSQKMGHYPEVGQLLDEEKPDVVVYFNCLLGKLDCLREVKRRNIPLVLDIPNWDQASSKGPLVLFPDFAFTWSKNIREDFCNIHDFPSSRVFPIGALGFDYYFQGAAPIPRQEFCELYDIDPESKIVLYAYGKPANIDATNPIVDDIRSIIGEEKLGVPCHLLFRASPSVAFPQHLRGQHDVSIQYPLGERLSGKQGWMPAVDEAKMRMSTIFHSSLVINIFSTMLLDSLSLKKPVINYGYIPNLTTDDFNPMDRFFTYTHIQPVMNSLGTYIPKSSTEMRTHIKACLDTPDAYQREGEELLNTICGYSDGKSYLRWLDALRKILDSTN